ncbi:MAG: ComEC/Rec2 family competence protein [Spirochaetota bacterium]
MAWPLAFFTFVALALFSSKHMPGGSLAAIVSVCLFGWYYRKCGRRFLPVLAMGVLLGTWLFAVRSGFLAEKTPTTEGLATVSSVSRRSVILTLDDRTRLRLTGFRNERLPLRGARIKFSCRPYEIPEGDFATFERLSGVRTWCEKSGIATINEPKLAAARGAALAFLQRRFEALGEQSLIAAFLLGDTETMPPKTLAAFRDMGLMHLFAVSGLNVALLFALLYLPFRFAGIPSVGAVLGFLIATAFLLLLDFPVPLFRAWLFLAIGALARLLDRRLSPWTLLFLTALVVEALFPLSTFTISFILSFGITAAILLFYQPLFFCFNGESRLRKILASHLALTLAAGLPAFVLSYLLFGNAQALALLYNLLLVPFSGMYLFAAILYIATDTAARVVHLLDKLYLLFADMHRVYVMSQLPVPEGRYILIPLAAISFILLLLLYLQARKRLWSARRNLHLAVPAALILLALPWLITPRVQRAFYGLPNQVWSFGEGEIFIAGEPLFQAEAPEICLPVKTESAGRVRGGVVLAGKACYAFAASLKPELWQANEFSACRSVQIFQSKKRVTEAKEWEKLFQLFGLRGPVELRNYFTWYADRPLSCSKSKLF